MSGNSTDIRADQLSREAWGWVLRTTSGHATRADREELAGWCAQSPLHAAAFERASLKWGLLGEVLEQSATRTPYTRDQRRAHANLGRRAFVGGAIAASAAGAVYLSTRSPLLGPWPSLSELSADFRTATGEKRRVALAGRVTVEMNTQTSLNIHSAHEVIGIELIAGEAVIGATEKPVEVRAAGVIARGANAQFDVRRQRDRYSVSVTCLSGAVEVEERANRTTIGAGRQVVCGEGAFSAVAAVDAVAATGWLRGDLFFEDEPLSRVLEEINRYRAGKIVLVNDTLGSRRFTGHFRLDRLDAAIGQLRAIFGARVTTLPGGLVVLS